MFRLRRDLRQHRGRRRRRSKLRKLALRLPRRLLPPCIRIARNAQSGRTTHLARNIDLNRKQRIAPRRLKPCRDQSRKRRRSVRRLRFTPHRRRNAANKPSVPNHVRSNARSVRTAPIVPTGNSACLKPATCVRNRENGREYAIIAASET